MWETMTRTVTLIPGDGIGPEVSRATVRMLEPAARVKRGVYRVYEEGRWLTRDVGGKASTEEFTSAVIDAMGWRAFQDRGSSKGAAKTG